MTCEENGTRVLVGVTSLTETAENVPRCKFGGFNYYADVKKSVSWIRQIIESKLYDVCDSDPCGKWASCTVLNGTSYKCECQTVFQRSGWKLQWNRRMRKCGKQSHNHNF